MFNKLTYLIFALAAVDLLSFRHLNTPPESAFAPKEKIQNSLNRTFNENVWQNDSIIALTNCFSYAMDLADAGFSVPGDLKLQNRGDTVMGHGYYRIINGQQDITCAKIRRLLKRDEFIRISKEEALSLSPEFNVFACYVAPHYDFHFIRKDGEYWSHKRGKNPPRTLVNADGTPWIPGGPYSGKYTHFVGFYRAPDTGIKYVPRQQHYN